MGEGGAWSKLSSTRNILLSFALSTNILAFVGKKTNKYCVAGGSIAGKASEKSFLGGVEREYHFPPPPINECHRAGEGGRDSGRKQPGVK